jgi:hypothetical protein
MSAMERGDYGDAAERLRTAGEQETDPERIELAVYLRAVALQRAGRGPEAAAAAGDYLARYPVGRFVAEARALAAEP